MFGNLPVVAGFELLDQAVGLMRCGDKPPKPGAPDVRLVDRECDAVATNPPRRTYIGRSPT
jgi:hypothetical protein